MAFHKFESWTNDKPPSKNANGFVISYLQIQ